MVWTYSIGAVWDYHAVPVLFGSIPGFVSIVPIGEGIGRDSQWECPEFGYYVLVINQISQESPGDISFIPSG